MAASQRRLSPEELELYFAAGVSVTARDVSRTEKRRALAEGRALGMSSWIGAFASGDASMVPLGPSDSLSKVVVVVPPGHLATPCFASDREHEVWSRFYEAQLDDACDGLTPQATERVRKGSRELAVELARLLPPEVADPLLEQWTKPSTRAQTYAQQLFELASLAARVPNPPPRFEERLRRDAQRKFIGLLCRAKLGRDGAEPATPNATGVTLTFGQRTVRLIPRQRVDLTDTDVPTEAVATVRCDACAMIASHVAPVTYDYYDDDHYGVFELWYESRHDAACAACGAEMSVALHYTLTEVTDATRHRYFIEIDRVAEKSAKLCVSG